MSPRRSKAALSNKAVIVGGRRTPFVRAAGEMQTLDVLELARTATNELLAGLDLDPAAVETVIFGNVSRPVKYHNLAREVVLATRIPRSVPAYTVSLACTSSCVSATNAIDLIERGYANAVIAGGSESLSNVPIQYSDPLARALIRASRAKTPIAKAQTLATVRMRDLKPVAPGINETSTGLSMGQSAEAMAKINGVTREEQDELALDSHLRAAAEIEERRSEIAPVFDGRRGRAIENDNHIRSDTSLEKLAALPPVFDRAYGTVTAGNSSPLTDGASALLLMSATRAAEAGHVPRAAVRSYAYAAVDPADQLLLGPAYAIPIALDRAGLTLADIDVVEMHEAFAAQVMSTLKCLASKEFAEKELGRPSAVGEINRDRLNIGGGSIALGHPFGATGVRVLMDLVRHLEKVDGQIGLASVCAAGGVGCAIVLERL